MNCKVCGHEDFVCIEGRTYNSNKWHTLRIPFLGNIDLLACKNCGVVCLNEDALKKIKKDKLL